MPDFEQDGVIYYRGKGDAVGSVIVGLILLAFAFVVLTGTGVGGIPFSADLTAMATYLALPLGVVLVLAHVWHVMAKGPTMVAGKQGITVLYTGDPVGPIRWAEIKGFKVFRRNGNPFLGITLDDPAQTLYPYRESGRALFTGRGPKDAHLMIRGKMLDEDTWTIAERLEEMRLVHSWKR